MNKIKVKNIFEVVSQNIADMPPAEVFENFGAAIGLVTLALEKTHSVDRNATLKMLQRNAHATMKEMDSAAIKKNRGV